LEVLELSSALRAFPLLGSLRPHVVLVSLAILQGLQRVALVNVKIEFQMSRRCKALARGIGRDRFRKGFRG